MNTHVDCQPGLVMEGVTLTRIENHGYPGWKAVAPIGSIFGAEVKGECIGYGKTKQEALKRLKEDQDRLYESLWA